MRHKNKSYKPKDEAIVRSVIGYPNLNYILTLQLKMQPPWSPFALHPLG